MSGVLFAKVVAAEGAFLQAKAGRGGRPGVKLGPGLFDDSSFGCGQVSPSGSECGVGLSADLRERSFTRVPGARAICVHTGGSGVDEVIAKTMASALFLSKSMRHSSAPCCAPELSVRDPPQEFPPGRHAVVRWRRTNINRGLLSCRRYAGRRRGPHYLCSRK
jgi:hypothetical protein